MFLYYTHDGLWDLWIGALVLAWGLAIRFEFAGLIGGIGAGVGVVWWLRKGITYPRAGYARLLAAGRIRKRLVAAGSVMAALGLTAFILERQQPSPFLHEHFPMLFGVLVAVVLGIIAHWLLVSRFYVYAALLFLAGAVHQWGGFLLWRALTIAGVVIILSGVVVLVRFLREHPRIAEAPNAE